jgi:hypothetical protein
VPGSQRPGKLRPKAYFRAREHVLSSLLLPSGQCQMCVCGGVSRW